MNTRTTLSGLGCFFLAGVLSLTASPLPQLKISENRRYLVTERGDPFFWLGDTAWELFHRLNRDEAELYLQNRADRKYTVIQAVVLAELDGLNTPNAYGHFPLVNNDPTKPSEEYFKHVDWIVASANTRGMYVGILPTWGTYWYRSPESIFTPETAEIYGNWLGQRYRDAGVVWILGGDRSIASETHKDIIRAMARGLRAGDQGRHLITFHPPGGRGSAQWFHEEPWLDFNMRQNGHAAEFTGRYEQTRVDYERLPTKPIIDGEPIYEDHPVSFEPAKSGYSIAADVRRPLYWDLFGGACGHTYGHHSVWQMYSVERKPRNSPLMPWSEAILQPGGAQMQHGRALMESRPFLNRIPDDDLLVQGPTAPAMPGAGRYHFCATREANGSYAMVYAPIGRAFRVRLAKLSGETLSAWWYDPRTGTATSIGSFTNTRGEREFVPPTPGEALDWILVLDDAAKRFPPPGKNPQPL